MGKLEEMYGMNYPIASFAVGNEFVKTMNKGCYQLGQILKPFCLFAGEEQEKYGVVDLAVFDGLVDTGKSLVKEISDYRRSQYNQLGFGGLQNDTDMDKLLFIDYLLSVSICYVEIPKWVTKNGVAQKTYDKFLATKNPNIMATWMGATPNEMQGKYSAKISSTPADFANYSVKVVKLKYTGKGNVITCPRGSYDTRNMTCTPLFLIYAFMKGAFNKLTSGILKFTYLKDNGTIRELCSTVNRDILMDYYHDADFVDSMLGGCDLFTVEQGGMKFSAKQDRGYSRLPELGSSRYDPTGVRALNLARILKVEEVAEADRTFIDVDISSVIANFEECLDYILAKKPDVLPDIYTALGVKDDKIDLATASAVTIAQAIKEYVSVTDVVLSTTFRRQLHLFMAEHNDWFSTYTGKPNAVVTSSANFGVGVMDF